MVRVLSCCFLLFFTLACSSPLCAEPKKAELSVKENPENKAISDLIELHAKAWNTGDAKAAAANFTSDADHVSSDGSRTHGKDEIKTKYAKIFQSPRFKNSKGKATNIDIRFVASNVAIVNVNTTLSGLLTDAGKELPTQKGFYTAVVVKSSSGWKITALRSIPLRSVK